MGDVYAAATYSAVYGARINATDDALLPPGYDPVAW